MYDYLFNTARVIINKQWYERHGTPRRPAIIQVKEEYFNQYKFTVREQKLIIRENKKQTEYYMNNAIKVFPVRWTKDGLNAAGMRYGIYHCHKFSAERPDFVYGINEFKDEPENFNFYGELNKTHREFLERQFEPGKNVIMGCMVLDRKLKWKNEDKDFADLQDKVDEGLIVLSEDKKQYLVRLERERRMERRQSVTITDAEAEMYGMQLSDRVTLMEENGRDYLEEWASSRNMQSRANKSRGHLRKCTSSKMRSCLSTNAAKIPVLRKMTVLAKGIKGITFSPN
jgi:hypothetical protein